MTPTPARNACAFIRGYMLSLGVPGPFASLLVALTLATLTACAGDRPLPEPSSSPMQRAWDGVMRVASGSPWTLSPQSVATAFDLPADALVAYPGDGTIDNLGGYAFVATPKTPFHLGMAYQDPAHKSLSFVFSLDDESPRRSETPLPFCMDVVAARSRIQEAGWHFVRLSQAPQQISSHLLFVKDAGGHRALLTLTYAAVHAQPTPGDCLDRVSVVPDPLGF